MSAPILIKTTGKHSTVLFSFLIEFFARLMNTSRETQKVIKQGKNETCKEEIKGETKGQPGYANKS